MKKTKKVVFSPLVSIVIPVYNGSNYVAEAIDSALAQTYKNIEIIVVNDGSTDNSEEIIKSYGNKLRYFKKENGGVSTALNLGIKKAKGEYISWLSHDDLYYPNKIERQINFLSGLDKKTIIFSNYENINKDSKLISTVFLEKKYPLEKLNFGIFVLLNGLVHGCTLLVCKKIIEEFNYFNVRYKTIQDYDLWFDIFRKYKVSFMKDILVKSREHNKQSHITLSAIAQKEQDILWDKMINDLNILEVSMLTGKDVAFFGIRKEEVLRPIRYASKRCLRKIIFENQRNKFTVVDINRVISSLPQMNKVGFIDFIRKKICLRTRLNYYLIYFRLLRAVDKEQKTVFIFEPNKYHGETFVSYVNYFNKLGYKVYFLLDYIHKKENPFCRLKSYKMDLFYTDVSFFLIKKIFRSNLLKHYDIVFVTSNLTYFNNEAISISNLIKNEDIFKKTYVMEHDAENVLIENEFELINQNRLFTLWPRKFMGCRTLMINPHFFGDVVTVKKIKKEKTFLVVGNLQKDTKSYTLLEDALKKLIKNKVLNFKVNIVGRVYDDINLLKEISKHVSFKGRLGFDEMFNLIENSDYLVLLLDSDCKEHYKYLNRLVSGALDLSLGFLTPLILSDFFAPSYSLNSENSIVYCDNNLYDGLVRAINISEDNYLSLQKNIQSMSDFINEKSFKNFLYAIQKNSNSIHI